MDRNYNNFNYNKRNILPPSRSTSLYNFNNNINNNAPQERDYYISSSIENDYRINGRYRYSYNYYDFENSNYMASLVEKRSSAAPSRTQDNQQQQQHSSSVLREKLLNNKELPNSSWLMHDLDYLDDNIKLKHVNNDDADRVSAVNNHYPPNIEHTQYHQQQQQKRLYPSRYNANYRQLDDGDKNSIDKSDKYKLRIRNLTEPSGTTTINTTTDKNSVDKKKYNDFNSTTTHRSSISTNLPPTPSPPNRLYSTTKNSNNNNNQIIKKPSSPRVLIYKSINSRSPKLHHKTSNSNGNRLRASPVNINLSQQSDTTQLLRQKSPQLQSSYETTFSNNNNHNRTTEHHPFENSDVRAVLQSVLNTARNKTPIPVRISSSRKKSSEEKPQEQQQKQNIINIKSTKLDPSDSTDDGSSLEDDDDFDDDSLDDGIVESSSDSDDGYKRYAHLVQLDNSLTPSPLPDSSNYVPKNPDSLLSPSLFPNVPPYLSFSTHSEKGPLVAPEIHKILKWKQSKVMPRVVRHTLLNSGCRLLTKTNDWMATWGKHLKSPCFRKIRPYQKVNHLPGSFCIGRKDSCWKKLKKQMTKHGKKEFGFMPKTYVIPQDLKMLRKSWPKYSERNVKWIIKPPACARGTGIKVVSMWCQIPKRRPLIVQKYIERPFLINGSKFDIRLYVLVTSVNPLRVYLYNDGLARFASVKYSQKNETLSDRCMHLTNYSINKHSSNYSKNEDVNACHGHKWTLKSLWAYLATRGINTTMLWRTMRNLVLRTLLASENNISSMVRLNVDSRYSCYELFGFDVLLDSDLIPWLLEVNISPSLHSDLPLDLHVKAPLVQAVLNTALYHIPPKLSIDKQKEICAQEGLEIPLCYDKRMYVTYLSRDEKIKHTLFTRKPFDSRVQYLDAILKDLTPDDVRCLIIAEDELARCAPLERIFPSNKTFKFLKYTEYPRYYNRLLDAWEHRYANDRLSGIKYLRELCKDNYHLEVSPQPVQRTLKIRTRTMTKYSIIASKTCWNIAKQRIIKNQRCQAATANLLKIIKQRKQDSSEITETLDTEEKNNN